MQEILYLLLLTLSRLLLFGFIGLGFWECGENFTEGILERVLGKCKQGCRASLPD